MKRFSLISASILFAFSSFAMAEKHDHDHEHKHEHEEKRQHGKHVHGEAELTAALEGDMLKMRIMFPMANVKDVDADKRDALLVNTFTMADADCHSKRYERLITAIKHDEKKEEGKETEEHAHDHEAEEKDEHAGHKDITVSYDFHCHKLPEKLTVTTKLFEQFSAMEKINVQWLTEKGQGMQVLTKDEPTLKLHD